MINGISVWVDGYLWESTMKMVDKRIVSIVRGACSHCVSYSRTRGWLHWVTRVGFTNTLFQQDKHFSETIEEHNRVVHGDTRSTEDYSTMTMNSETTEEFELHSFGSLWSAPYFTKHIRA
jgi:hypothetical protein